MSAPIFDMHCDLLSYLAKVPEAGAYKTSDIACAVPFLKEGKVNTQVCAIYTDVRSDSMDLGLKQAQIFRKLQVQHSGDLALADAAFLSQWDSISKIGFLASIENAAGLGSETASWQEIETQFDSILNHVGPLAYISLTHHTENRFGGGNYTDGIGLKKDGKRLLEMISGKKIPIDLSHTSDLLAEGILSHLTKQNLEIPVIASHSNFRSVWDHKRNLTDEFAKEIIHRKGLIGINFLRAFLDPEKPEKLFEHILHGFEIGAEDQMCFGADYFYTKDFGDASRYPFYFPLAENASKYPSLLKSLSQDLSPEQLAKLGSANAVTFYRNLWS